MVEGESPQGQAGSPVSICHPDAMLSALNFVYSYHFTVEEVPIKIYCISSAAENIIMENLQKISIYMFSVALAYNGISIIVFLKATDSDYFCRGTRSGNILIGTSSTLEKTFEVF